MNDDITARTGKALGESVMVQLAALHFCIVGCGGTGANFAEMLVRTGAIRLTLVDGTHVKESNLNRVFGFYHADIDKPKVHVLKDYLESIRPGKLDITPLPESFRDPDLVPINPASQRVRDAVHDADVVFVATDKNTSRRAIQKLQRDSSVRGMMLSCAVYIDAEKDIYKYECNWFPATLPEAPDMGYGPHNASYAAILMEATSVSFTMLLSHLKCPDSDFRYYRRQFDACLRPVETSLEWETSSENGP